MTQRVIEELIRAVAYGGIGALVGFLVATWFSDRHRVVTEILHESEVDMPSPPRFLNPETLRNLFVIVLMVMMLLTGLLWLKSDQDDRERSRDDCLRAAETSRTLGERTQNYLEKAVAERRLWSSQRRALLDLGIEPTAPIITNIDRYQRAQRDYIEHLKANPYPQGDPEDC